MSYVFFWRWLSRVRGGRRAATSPLLPWLGRAAGALALFALLPGGAWAQGTYPLGDAATATETSGSRPSKTMSFTAPAGSNRLLVVSSSGGGNTVNAPTVTFNGAALTQGVAAAAGTSRTGLWYLWLGSSVTATTGDIVVTYSGNFSFDVTAITVQDVDATRPVSNPTTGTSATLDIISAVGDLAFDAIVGAGAAVAVPVGQRLVGTTSNLVGGADPDSGMSLTGGASFATMRWTGFTSGIAHVGFNVRQAPGIRISFNFHALAGGTVDQSYRELITATGGDGTKSFSLVGGALPPGITLSPAGPLSGTPTTAGRFEFVVAATDQSGALQIGNFTLFVYGPPTFTLPTAAAIAPTTARLGAKIQYNGDQPDFGIVYARTAINPNPQLGGTGVSKVTSTSFGSGVFAVDVAGLTPNTAYSYRAYGTTADTPNGTSYSAVGTFTTAPPLGLGISPATLPPATQNVAYTQTLTTTGGTGAGTFAVTAGALPGGLTLSAAGVLSGVPAATGTFDFTLTATDTVGATATQAYALSVGAPLALIMTTQSLPNAPLNTAYSQAITVTGGAGGTTIRVTFGTLPPGLTLTPGGMITGTPTTPGLYGITVSAVDSAGTSVLRGFTLFVPGTSTLAITTTTLPGAQTGVAGYRQAIAVTGGANPVVFTVVSGAVPPGLTLSAEGTLSGTATAAGTYSFTVSAKDAGLNTASRAVTIVVVAGPTAQTIAFGSLADRVVGDAPFTLSAAATSGLPVTFTVTGPAAVSGNILTLTGQAGQVAVTAAQAGNTTFAAAPNVTQRFAVAALGDRIVNLSARVRIAPDPTRSLIAGFVIGGTLPKRVVVRAIGPALTGFGVEGALVNPRLQIFNAAGAVVIENDDWSGSDTAAAFSAVSAFALTTGSKDAALVTTLAPGSYTMQITAGTETGIALAEVYDASPNPGAETQRLVNISTRGMVEAGDGVLIGGFVIRGASPKKMLIRGIGPQLGAFGVAGTLADPRLSVLNGQTVVAQNDNWSTPATVVGGQPPATAAELAAVSSTVGAFALTPGSPDSAVLVTLPPGSYTAQVAGAGTTTGVALVEIYEVP